MQRKPSHPTLWPAALGLCAALLATVAAGCGSSTTTDPATLSRDAVGVVSGIPQHGAILGDRGARVTLTVFVDPTDPRYTVFAQEVLPGIVRDAVRPGELALRLRPFVAQPASDDEPLAASALQAATVQNRGWQLGGVFAATYTQYLDGPTLTTMVREVPGLRVKPLFSTARGARVSSQLDRAAAAASRAGAASGLSFVLGRRVIRPRDLTAGALLAALNRASGGITHAPKPAPARHARPPRAHRAPQRPGRRATPQRLSFSGLPQNGFALGRASARARLVIFADLTHSAYGDFERETLPQIVDTYVRPGQLLVELRTLSAPTGRAFAEQVARTAQAAGLQDALWPFAQALTTGASGRATHSSLDAALRDTAGLNAARARSDARSARIRGAIARSERRARGASITGPLGFALLTSSGQLRPLQVPGTPAGPFLTALRRRLGG